MHRYFEQYAEAECHQLRSWADSLAENCYQFAVCIPAYNESTKFIDSLAAAALASKAKQLLILVINRPSSVTHCEKNQAMLQFYCGFAHQAISHQMQHVICNACLDVLLIDCESENPLPPKNGVGLARKIAADCASWLLENHIIAQPYFFSSDADVCFPINYFSAATQTIAQQTQSAAWVLNFRHDQAGQVPSIVSATQTYERSLHHYVDGLAWAKSHYAFHSIGSCLLIQQQAYVAVRGFPKRAAGEDFYLLNKLQKHGTVNTLADITLSIACRISDRVPFGTGPAVSKLLNGEQAIFYHPECFHLLRQWLMLLNQLANSGLDANDEFLEQQVADMLVDALQQPLLQQLSKQLQLQARAVGFLRQFKQTQQRCKAFDDWFDGFQTLKAIHFFTQYYPKLDSPQKFNCN